MPTSLTIVKSWMKRLPMPLKKSLAAPYVYLERLRLWKRISSEVRFVSGPNGNALRRSIAMSPITALKGLGKWQHPVMLGDATIEAIGVGRFHVRARCDDLYHVIPSHEAAVMGALRSILQEGDTFIDAGANIGIYTVAGAHIVGQQGKVIAIEMMPDTAEQLQKNVRINGLSNVTIVQRALSDSAGSTINATLPSAGLFGQASISVRHDAGARAVAVETETLENIIGASGIRLMKMDLEGAEKLALEGARGALQHVEAIIFESHDATDSIGPELVAHGFRVRPLDGRNLLAEREQQGA